MMRSILTTLTPAALLLLAWEILSSQDDQIAFFFASPSKVVSALYNNTINGILLNDLLYTALPTISGFIISTVVGAFIGLMLAANKDKSTKMRAYLSVLANIPVFAIAPMMIVWFGIGLNMKLALAVFATIFVTMSQAYDGATSVTSRQIQIFNSFGASKFQLLRHLLLPGAISWIINGMKVTTSLALLGTFIGEFMASEHGLAHRMLKAGSLYDVSLVLACAVWMITLVLALNGIAIILNRSRLSVIQFLSVNQAIWARR